MSGGPVGAGAAAPEQSDVGSGAAVSKSTKGGGVKGRVDRAGERFRGMPSHTFGPASEEPYRRRTSDWVRVAVALAAVVLLVVYQRQSEPRGNQDLFRFFNGLPNDLQPFFQTLYWAGTLWIGAGGRRGRVHCAVAGDWLAIHDRGGARRGRGPGDGATRRRTIAVEDVRRGHTCSVSLPSSRWCVSRSSPRWLRRRRLVVTPADVSPRAAVRVRCSSVSAMYLGSGYPSDILGALFLGWGVAALVHLAFGSPGGRPTKPQVAASLAELGVACT